MRQEFEIPKKNNILHANIFESRAWIERKEAIEKRVKKRIERQKQRKLQKKVSV